MKTTRALLARLGGLFGSARQERELTDELDSHVQLHTEDNMRAGMSPQQARRAALIHLGGAEKTRQAYRDRSTLPLLENLLQDLHFALRQLGRNPGFAVTAILILTLGISANVAIFAFVDAALIKPLPYRQPNRLVALFESIPSGPRYHLSLPDFRDWQKQNTVFSSLAVYGKYHGFTLSTAQGTEQVEGESVSDGFFQTLGVVPALGRDFRAGEDLPSAQRTVLLSYAAWQKRYGGSSDAVGKVVDLDGEDTLIIGVLPKDFHFAPAEPADFWGIIHEDQDCRACHSAYAIGRLKDGVGLQAASAQMKLIAKQIEKQNPDTNRDRGAYLLPLTDLIVGDVRPILLLLLSGAALLLLIACVNVSSLLLVRAESRKREIAVRSALGASPARLMHQFVTEGLLLAIAGSVLGIASARGLMRLLVQLVPVDILTSMPYLQNLGINLRVLTFACAIGLLAAILFSLTPILRLKRADLREGLADGGRGSAGTMWRRFGANLVIVELATAMVLLVGAALLGQSFYRLLHVDPGLNPDHVAIMRVGIEGYGAVDDKNFVPFLRNIIDRLSALPGVKSVGVTTHLPVGDGDDMMEFVIAGHPDPGLNNEVPDRRVSSGYFTTLQTRLLRGRFFTEDDDASKPDVVIINEAFAKKYFPAEDPIGKRIERRAAVAADSMQIIGVLDDLREGPLDLAPAPATYEPFNQGNSSDFSLVLRTSQDAQTLFPTITATIHSINPSLTAHHPLTMEERIQDSPTAYLHRASAWLVGGFAGLALVLGVVGLYGVIAYSVSQRTREIGVRMALGAQRSSVYRLILSEAGRLTIVGIGAGLVCSLAAAMLMRKMLFGVSAWDIRTFLSVALVLALASLLASYIPARRAASVHPTEALRAE